MTDDRQGLIERIDREKERIVRFFQDFTRVDTYNPPGDTRAGATFIRRFLDESKIPYKVIAPQETMPNLLASVAMGAPGRARVE